MNTSQQSRDKPEKQRQTARVTGTDLIALPRLAADAGRFRRHKSLMQAVRDLHNGLSRLWDAKKSGEDPRQTSAEVAGLYYKLLTECDGIRGPRRI
jgi:hypothetical protein